MKWLLGIDVGSYYVKVSEGCIRNGRIILRRIGYFPSPFTNFKDNLNEREQDVFVKALKNFLSQHTISTKTGILSISGTGTVIHYFNIPDLPPGEIESAVQLEMMQVVPGGIRNLEYDYVFLPNGNKKTILFIGYHKDKCDFIISTMQMAGIKPLVMDYDGLAILNSFTYLHAEYEGIIFILNVGYKTTNLVIAEKDKFILVRDLPFGSKNVIDTIALEKNISSEEAEIYIKKGENKNEIKKMIPVVISDLITETRVSIDYFKKITEKTAQSLFLTGGGAFLPGLKESLEKDMNIPTNVWNPLEEIETEIPIPIDIKETGTIFSISLGLILRKIK
ncbi:MAG: pilus assembly protein PilM [bacterium]|nr:pilus assembly protein PilM [bacterium]